MSNSLTLPADFGGKGISARRKELEKQLAQNDNLTGGGSFGNKISIRGSVFRKVVDGEEVAQIEDRALKMVIVKAAPLGRTYYDKAYVEGENFSPACWSADCKAPSPDVAKEDRQADLCKNCPMDIKGSGQGESRACSFHQRVAIMLEGAIEPESPVYQLIVPSKSLFGSDSDDKGRLPLRAYAKFMSAQGVPIAGAITEMKFDSSSSTPKLLFRPIRRISDDEFDVVLAAADSPETAQALEMSFVKMDNGPEVTIEEPEVDAPAPVIAKKAKPAKQPKPLPQVVAEEELAEDDAEDEAAAVAKFLADLKAKRKPKPAPVVADDEEEEEPKVRVKKAKAQPDSNVDKTTAVLEDWDDE